MTLGSLPNVLMDLSCLTLNSGYYHLLLPSSSFGCSLQGSPYPIRSLHLPLHPLFSSHPTQCSFATSVNPHFGLPRGLLTRGSNLYYVLLSFYNTHHFSCTTSNTWCPSAVFIPGPTRQHYTQIKHLHLRPRLLFSFSFSPGRLLNWLKPLMMLIQL